MVQTSKLLCHQELQKYMFEWCVPKMCKTVSVIGLEFFSLLESGFPGALHLQSTVKLVLQYLSHRFVHHHFENESRFRIVNALK